MHLREKWQVPSTKKTIKAKEMIGKIQQKFKKNWELAEFIEKQAEEIEQIKGELFEW